MVTGKQNNITKIKKYNLKSLKKIQFHPFKISF